MFDFAKKIETIQIKCCRWILGVSWNCSNLAILGELGRLPMSYHVILNNLKYWSHIKLIANEGNDSKNTLLPKILNHMHKHKSCSWLNNITKCLKEFGLDIDKLELPDSKSKVKLINNIKAQLEKHCKCQWKTRISKGKRPNTNSKMRTYITFKDDLSLEPYLTSKLSLQNKISFTKFRLSDTKLEIETGRSKNIPLIDRKCKQCTSGDVEDEFHFFMSCKYFDNERRELFDSISPKGNKFTSLSD